MARWCAVVAILEDDIVLIIGRCCALRCSEQADSGGGGGKSYYRGYDEATRTRCHDHGRGRRTGEGGSYFSVRKCHSAEVGGYFWLQLVVGLCAP